ncbi:MAG: DUF2310 family Zn-ribbon-containing protein [Gammaproteobacteria bacterium]|nr:DUF2310 family Zn-ribbon-containing protein [Gammaproteobacteria bacterium]
MQDIELSSAQSVIAKLLDEYRYNGQIIGREFPIIFNGEFFEVIFVCPEQDSLSERYNNEAVNEAFENLSLQGLSLPEFEVKGLESHSDFTDLCHEPTALVIYSTFVQSCSPVRCLEHFSPVPLYKLPEQTRKSLVKWQESYGACDQLQMNEVQQIEQGAVQQLSESNSDLMLQAQKLADDIEANLKTPVYRYLYRVGGDSLAEEQARKCPSCHGEWLLEQPLHDLFDFKCDACGLLSNISWDWQ